LRQAATLPDILVRTPHEKPNHFLGSQKIERFYGLCYNVVKTFDGAHPLGDGLLSYTFCAFQHLTPATGYGVDDPVSLLLTNNQVLLFEDIEMVGKF
jgi:hypothetical protein